MLSTSTVVQWQQNCKFNDRNITSMVDPWYWVIFYQLRLKFFCSTVEGIFTELNNNAVAARKNE